MVTEFTTTEEHVSESEIMKRNQLLVEPTGDGDNDEQVSKTLGVTEGMYIPDCRVVGGSADLIQVSDESKLVTLIANKYPQGKGLKFNVYERPQSGGLPQQVEIAVKSGQLQVIGILNRRVRKNLMKIRVARSRPVVVQSKP